MNAQTPFELWALLQEDYRAHGRDWNQPGLWAITLHRLGRFSQTWRSRRARSCARLAHSAVTLVAHPFLGIELPLETQIGRRVRFWHHGCMRIQARRVGDDVQFRQNTIIGPNHPSDLDPANWPEIGDRVDLGSGACIRGGVEVGDDALVGANSLVSARVAPGSTVVGVPARELPRRGKPRPVAFHEPFPKGMRDQNPKDLSLLKLIAEDFRTHEGRVFDPGAWAIAVHRFGNWRMSVERKSLRAPLTLLYRAAFQTIRQCFGIDLPYDVKLGRRVRIAHHGSIHVGARSIGNDVVIRHAATIGLVRGDQREPKPIIEDRVEIGPRACIIGNVTIGSDSVIGANTVVPIDVPPHTVALGVPVRFVKPIRIATEPLARPSTDPKVFRAG